MIILQYKWNFSATRHLYNHSRNHNRKLAKSDTYLKRNKIKINMKVYYYIRFNYLYRNKFKKNKKTGSHSNYYVTIRKYNAICKNYVYAEILNQLVGYKFPPRLFLLNFYEMLLVLLKGFLVGSNNFTKANCQFSTTMTEEAADGHRSIDIYWMTTTEPFTDWLTGVAWLGTIVDYRANWLGCPNS